jgi:hypothetical protein
MTGSPAYSEMTPGSDFSMECSRTYRGDRYWEFDPIHDSLDDFRKKLMSAERCKDFKPLEV